MKSKTSSGFTLIEILVAFVIATTSLVLLFQIHSRSTGTVILGEEYLAATMIAQSLVDEFSITEVNAEFFRSGVEVEKYRWTVDARAFVPEVDDPELEQEATNVPSGFELRAITVAVEWSGRDRDRRITIHAIKPFFSQPVWDDAPRS